MYVLIIFVYLPVKVNPKLLKISENFSCFFKALKTFDAFNDVKILECLVQN